MILYLLSANRGLKNHDIPMRYLSDREISRDPPGIHTPQTVQQTSVGVKKLVGGLAFGELSYFVMAAAIKNVSSAEAQAGISCILPSLTRVIGLITERAGNGSFEKSY